MRTWCKQEERTEKTRANRNYREEHDRVQKSGYFCVSLIINHQNVKAYCFTLSVLHIVKAVRNICRTLKITKQAVVRQWRFDRIW